MKKGKNYDKGTPTSQINNTANAFLKSKSRYLWTFGKLEKLKNIYHSNPSTSK